MTSFVLVHGAWHGSWCYSRVAKILRAAGHEVFTPTLTGLGERSHLMRPEIDLDTHITDVLNVFKWEDLSNVVLCGHSYGGFVVTGVADAIADKIAAIVYLDAYVPCDGDSVMSLLSKERQAQILRDTQQHDNVAVAPPAPERYGVNRHDIEWVRSKLTPHPLRTFQQPIRLTGNHHKPKRTYVHAIGQNDSAPLYERYRCDPLWTVRVMDHVGHDQMVDDPATVAEILISTAHEHAQSRP